MTDERGAPVGRRVFLGLVGLGAAGVVVGAKVQDWLEQVIAPIEAKDFTGLSSLLPFGQLPLLLDHRQTSRTAPATQYTLQVKGLVEQPVHDLVRGAHGDARRRR